MTRAYRIKEWVERYEVDEKGACARPGKTLRAAPLEYVRWKVNGHIHGPGYRRLIQVAQKPARIEAAIATFAKLLEIAANQDREHRGWILTDRQESATIADLAFYTGFRPKTIELGLDVLCHPDVAWVEVSEFSRICAEFPGVPGNSAPKRNETELNETEHEEKQKQKQNETEPTSDSGENSSPGFSDSGSASSGSASDPSAKPVTRQLARVKFMASLDPLLGRVNGTRHPSGSAQREADVTVARQWWGELVWPESVDDDVGRTRYSRAVGLIEQAGGKVKPMAWLTRRLQQELA